MLGACRERYPRSAIAPSSTSSCIASRARPGSPQATSSRERGELRRGSIVRCSERALFDLARIFEKADGDGGAAAGRAVDAHRAAVQIDQRLGQRKTEAGAGVASRQAAVDLREGLERPRDVLRRYADPGVSDDEVDEPGF